MRVTGSPVSIAVSGAAPWPAGRRVYLRTTWTRVSVVAQPIRFNAAAAFSARRQVPT